MRFRALLAVLLVQVLLVLTVLAYASPTDPLWIAGVYDEGDFDEVVTLIVSGVALSEAFPVGHPVSVFVTGLASTSEKAGPVLALAPAPARSPPSA
jgi:hypothetical protein